MLEDAVAIRVQPAKVPTADCSGGLDSTTLCLLAARTKPITAFTIHPAGASAGGDLDHARAATTGQKNISHVLLPMRTEHDPCAGMDQVPPTDEPAPSTVTFARLAAQLQLLAALGSDAHLTGDGGDTLFMLPPRYLADLLRAGRLVRLARDTMGWARLRQISPWPILAAAISAARTPPSAPTWCSYAAIPGGHEWATPVARQLAGDLAHGIRWSTPGLDLAGRVTLAETRLVARTARADAQLADVFGVPMHNPMLDSQVLVEVLATPARHRGSPRAYKPLLSAAVADVLPPAVAKRGTKGSFDADHYRGIRSNFSALLALSDGHLTAAGLLAPAALRIMLTRAAAGLPVALARLESVLAAEVWLRAIDVAPPIRWETANAPDLEPA